MTDKAKVDALRKQTEQQRRFRNLAMVLANDVSFGTYPMAAAWLADDERSYDDRLTDARNQIDTARSSLSDFDKDLALGGSIAAPFGLGVLGAGGRVARELSLPGANAMYAAGQLTRPAVMGGAGLAGAYDPRLTPDEQKREYAKGFLGAYLPSRAGASFPEIRDYGGLAVDAVRSARAARQRRPRPEAEPIAEPPRPGPAIEGQGSPGVFRPPPRTAEPPQDVNELLAEIDQLSKQIGANGEEISQLRYSQNRQRLKQNPNSLQSRLERGPESYSPPPDRMQPLPPPQGPLAYDPRFSGQRPMSRDQLRRMQMAHGEFRASIDGPQAAFRAGEITEAEFNAAAKRAVTRAARGNNVDPRYLAEQIAKDQRRDPKGWALTFPDKK